ncbi:MAG: hypothetical protein KJ626_01050 [Verrucomicrobia bacterium]|nr:hypothetical protein [Verrucomicrobiota bacterium]
MAQKRATAIICLALLVLFCCLTCFAPRWNALCSPPVYGLAAIVTFFVMAANCSSFLREHIGIFSTAALIVTSLAMGILDHCGAWEHLTGRSVASEALQGIHKKGRYPRRFIEEEKNPIHYRATLQFLLRNTSNGEVRKLAQRNLSPMHITRAEGKNLVPPLPEDWPDFTYVPDTYPIVLNYVDDGRTISHWAGSMRDAYGWLEDEKNFERFVISIILTNILSLLTLALTSRRQRPSSTPTPS